jgi:membrane fusion protein (multidrug efflux system)
MNHTSTAAPENARFAQTDSAAARLNPVPSAPEPPAKPAKRQWLKAFVVVMVIAAIAGAVMWRLRAAHYESTDDAFLEGHVIPVAAKVDGYVVVLRVEDNQHVNAGDVIAEIDPRDYEAALQTAESEVTASRARVFDAKARLTVLAANIQQAKAEVAAAEANARFAVLDSRRYQEMGDRAASRQERERSEASESATRAQVEGARNRVAAAEAQAAEGATTVTVAEAETAQAEARLRQPRLNLAYTKIIAAQNGRVARRTVEQGSYVKAGQTLLAIVSDEVWVVANFKEIQITRMRPGQPVTISVDSYPGKVFRGHVDSLQSGTGSRFSLLPPENATGNYVKVVQRLPVKIRLDNAGESWPFLAPGMSVEAEAWVR